MRPIKRKRAPSGDSQSEGPKNQTNSLNDKPASVRDQVLELARSRRGVTRDEARQLIGRDVYAAFRWLRRKDYIKPGKGQRTSRAGKSIDIYFAVD